MKNKSLDKTESLESQVLKKLTEILSDADASLKHLVGEHEECFLLYDSNMTPISIWKNVHDMICGEHNVFKTTISHVKIFQRIEHAEPYPLQVRTRGFYTKLRDIIMLNGFEQLTQCSSPEEVLLKMSVMRNNV